MSDTLASVLKSEPDWTHLPPEVPPAIRPLHSALPDEGSPPARGGHLRREVRPEGVDATIERGPRSGA